MHLRYFVLVLLTAAAVVRAPAGVDRGAGVRAIFQDTCARCHGDGTGLAAAGIPDFTNAAWQSAHSDAELFGAIKNGLNGKMPPFAGILSDAQIQDMIRYVIRGFTPPPRQKLPTDALGPVGATLPPPGRGAGPVTYGRVGVYTQHDDNARTGQNLRETVLTPAAVASGRFGLLFRQDVDDQVFAQPLYVPAMEIAGGRHNIVIVATAANSIYAFDADVARAPYWHVNLGPPGSVAQHHFWCLDILGNMGIIGTPVIDPQTGTLYVVALTHEGVGWAQRLHALDLATGAERPHSPVLVTCPGFDPILQNQRPALLLTHGYVYVGYSSHCDVEPYHGFLFRFDPKTLAACGVFNPTTRAGGASIWQSGQGPAVGPDGQIVFVTSNGAWDGVHNFSDTVLSLGPDLAVRDWFTPSNYEDINRRDRDLNSSGAMVLPGTHEVICAGKEGVAYLLDLHHMGHLGDQHAVQRVRVAVGEVNGSAVYWKSRAHGAFVYVWGQNDVLKAYGFDGRRLTTRPVATGAQASAYPGGMLAISANGDRDGILWANAALTARGNAHVNGAGVLRAYDANDVRRELWDSNEQPARDACGRISKNAPPTVVNGKVYLASFGERPAGTGALYVYGLLPKATRRVAGRQ